LTSIKRKAYIRIIIHWVGHVDRFQTVHCHWGEGENENV
jgi:hypothetical protein